jgi:hypothetical protein
MKYVNLTVLLSAPTAFAYDDYPYQKFDRTHHKTYLNKIAFIQALRLQACCEQKSHRLGFGGFKAAVAAGCF